jgi:hypothetical protein
MWTKTTEQTIQTQELYHAKKEDSYLSCCQRLEKIQDFQQNTQVLEGI